MLREGDIEGQHKAAAPGGIDVYFDDVGGEHLRAAIARMNVGGWIERVSPPLPGNPDRYGAPRGALPNSWGTE